MSALSAVPTLLSLLLAQAPAAPPARPPVAAIPAHPDQLKFKPVEYAPPSAAEHRVALPNGMVVFIAEDRTLPLVNVSVLVRAGAYLEPAAKEGLAGLTGALIRRGGTRSLSAEELDEKLDFLAANVSTSIGATSGSAGLNCLADNLDEALAVFVEMLKAPRFQEDRLTLAREQELQELQRRNDDSSDLEAREWDLLLNGPDHFTNRFATTASLRSITRQDLLDFHGRFFHPTNMVVAVSGAFEREAMLRKLEAAFAGWPGAAPPVPPVPSELGRTAAPGLYRVQKDVNQGRVSIGLPGVRRDSPDVYALEVLNEILGGSGFTSRITRTVRTAEGLAYSAGSSMSFGTHWPGRFRAAFQSKSRSVAYATQLVLGEITRIREAPVTAEELDTIKRSLVETFPSHFASRAQAVGVFAADEYSRRDPGYWGSYRERIQAVTAADVQRVARQYLVPEQLRILVVGNQAEIALGDPEHPVALESLAPGGSVADLPLRDPLTMQPLPRP